MMGFIKFMQKRPSDNTIKIGRILFGLIYIGVLYYNFFVQATPNTIETTVFGQNLTENWVLYTIYWIIALWIVPIILGASNLCVAKKKIVRIIQIIFSVLLFIVASIIVEGPNLDIDTLVFMFAFLPMFAWITWKCITSKCLKYWEKVTKIRV